MGGSGGAAALIPLLNMIGIPFGVAKATGLFVSVCATSTASLMNIKRKTLDFKFALPLLITLTIFLPIGAIISQYLNEKTMKWMLAFFLFLSAFLIFFGKKEINEKNNKPWILYLVGSIVGLFSGIVGISGGNLIIATLILLGFNPKKMAVIVSFILPFSSLAGFITYAHLIHLNWRLILITAIAAITGGFTGNKIMHFNLNSEQIKKLIAVFLFFIALKLTMTLL
jgi:hypothetical protein